MTTACGKRRWVFSDGDLPPAGDIDPKGHEALMVTNLGNREARLMIDILFTDREPLRDIPYAVGGDRVLCLHLDEPLGPDGVLIPPGQYALVLRSDRPVVAVFGRLDVRQPNLSYYSVQGYSDNG